MTYLRPNTLMPNALWWARSIREDGLVVDPCGPGRMACVDTDDIARVAAVALTESGHAGHGYILTGPEALTSREQVATIADVLDRDIRFEDTAPEDFAWASIKNGTPVEAATTMANLNELFRAGRSGFVTDDVENVTGVAPHTFRDWCERHADAFGWAAFACLGAGSGQRRRSRTRRTVPSWPLLRTAHTGGIAVQQSVQAVPEAAFGTVRRGDRVALQ